jgi:hypothetical protein
MDPQVLFWGLPTRRFLNQTQLPAVQLGGYTAGLFDLLDRVKRGVADRLDMNARDLHA